MCEDSPQEVFVTQNVTHDDIPLQAVECDNAHFGHGVQHQNDSDSATVNIARRLDVVPVEALVPEDDSICDLPDVNNLSEYKEAAISYITGFIVRKLKQKITCMPCSQALTSDESVHPLLALKDRERCFQRILKANEGKAPRGRGTTAAIVAQVVTDCSEKNLFPQLHSHMFDVC
uniref:THAP domain containing 9 n=1 Tax=Nothobranchius korthausae TaxID=1143690 RepID=A0A1A8FIE8_9TELE